MIADLKLEGIINEIWWDCYISHREHSSIYDFLRSLRYANIRVACLLILAVNILHLMNDRSKKIWYMLYVRPIKPI